MIGELYTMYHNTAIHQERLLQCSITMMEERKKSKNPWLYYVSEYCLTRRLIQCSIPKIKASRKSENPSMFDDRRSKLGTIYQNTALHQERLLQYITKMEERKKSKNLWLLDDKEISTLRHTSDTVIHEKGLLQYSMDARKKSKNPWLIGDLNSAPCIIITSITLGKGYFSAA